MKLDRTGVVIEVRQFDQYAIRTDGSGRITLRNRKFLRKYLPVLQPIPRRRIIDDLKYLPTLPAAPEAALPEVQHSTTPAPDHPPNPELNEPPEPNKSNDATGPVPRSKPPSLCDI